jgi:uncharacterized protein YdhG (YjbR/CyaY superfamily)
LTNIKPSNVNEYIKSIPSAARPNFSRLRKLVKSLAPEAREVYSYGIIGYKIDDKRARVFISGWKDHVAIYPVPKNEELKEELYPYIKGKGTLWFRLDQSLPEPLLKRAIKALLEV